MPGHEETTGIDYTAQLIEEVDDTTAILERLRAGRVPGDVSRDVELGLEREARIRSRLAETPL